MTTSEEFAQLSLNFTDPIQYEYEIIRPIVLFSEKVAERSRQTGVERTRVGDKAHRFVEDGMWGLVDHRADQSGRKQKEYPVGVAEHIIYLKQLYPPLHYREIVRIIERRFDYKTNHHAVKKFLQQHPVLVQLKLDFTEFHQYEDAYQARWQVVRLWHQGWNKKSIAGFLKVSRPRVHQIIEAFKQEGFAGLDDTRTRPVNHPDNQLTLPLFKEILDIQNEYPRAGRFRVRGLLEKQYQEQERDGELPSERTVGRVMALNREFHGAPGPWQSARDEAKANTTPKYLLYRPLYRHQFWFIDVRYLVKIEERWLYSICIIEGYSRAILAGLASEYQDLTAVLQILYAALSSYGCPEVIVSDNAKVFYAADYCHILDTLTIDPKYIEKGKPWQNLIEAQLKIQLRIADFKFEQAQTVQDVQNFHAEFIDTFNTTRHQAHQERDDGRRTPMMVLSWVRGRTVNPELLQRLFQRLHFIRTVNRYGFVAIQRFYLYAEQGLSRQRVSVWIYEGQVRLEYQDTVLAQYQAAYDRRQKRLQEVNQPTVYQTPFGSPQLELFELDDDQWLKIQQRSYQRQNRSVVSGIEQLALVSFGVVVLLLSYLLATLLWTFFFPYV